MSQLNTDVCRSLVACVMKDFQLSNGMTEIPMTAASLHVCYHNAASVIQDVVSFKMFTHQIRSATDLCHCSVPSKKRSHHHARSRDVHTVALNVVVNRLIA